MVASTAYPVNLTQPSAAFPFTANGALTPYGQRVLLDMWTALNGANVIIPCSCTQVSTNVLALVPLVTSPVPMVNKNSQAKLYTVFSTWAFVAAATSTGNVSASVDPLSVLNVYKAQGATRAGIGDVVIGSQYFLTYVDTLNANAGGFVLR